MDEMTTEYTEYLVSAHSKQAALKALLKSIPPEIILDQADETSVYESDGLAIKRQKPWLVVLPVSLDQVQVVMRICHQHGIPVVARGAGTGLSGGALPHKDGVLLSLARFNEILEVDERNLTARVQPGVTNLSISNHVRHLGLYYAPDPSSQIACTIGGNVAENAGGVHCLKYGLTVHNVLKVLVVNYAGDMVSYGADSLDVAGYDLLAVINGSEGMLGVIVEVTVKLLVAPQQVQLIMAAFKSIRAASDAVGDIISAGVIPAGLEMMDRLAIRAAEDFVKVGYPMDAEGLLLCELDGSAGELEEVVPKVMEMLTAAGAYLVHLAASDKERESLWRGRKSAFPAVGRLSPDYLCMDGTIPRRKLADVLESIRRLSDEYGLRIANVFHAGDGNLHPLILFDANKPNELQLAEKMGGEILQLCVDAGGTITGEHGVGVEKLNQMCYQFNEAELVSFRALKESFDPAGHLNPDKVVPTLRRCAEFGMMHVSRGKELHAELERF